MAGEVEELAAHCKAIEGLIPFLDAMRSIAEIAWHRASQRLDPLAAYHQRIERLLARVAPSEQKTARGQLPDRPNAARVTALLLITAERGLCGSFAARLVDYGLERSRVLAVQGEEVRLICLGTRGRRELEKIGHVLLYARPLPSFSTPSYVDVEATVLELLSMYEQGAFSRLEVLHHTPVGRFQYQPAMLELLPPSITWGSGRAARVRIQPSVDARALVNQLVTEYILSGLYQATIESAVCEQLARVLAMRLATDSARKLLDGLMLAHNAAVRQEITSSLLEVIVGYETATVR